MKTLVPKPTYLEQRYKKLSLSFKWIDPTAIVLIGILSIALAFAFRGFHSDIGLPLGIGGVFTVFYTFLWILPISRIKLLSKHLTSVQNKLYLAVRDVDQIEEILPLLESISRQKFALRLMQLIIVGRPELKVNYGGLAEETLDWFIMIIRATEQIISRELSKHEQSTLRAKSELHELSESAQTGKGALETQAARLDMQSKQFQELQKVLVRI